MVESVKNILPEILIVDDDNTVVVSLHNVLQAFGRIRFANTAKRAFELVNEIRPDIILLDVELPDANGINVCKEIKMNEKTSSIPILFITSRDDVGFEEDVFDAGAADFIAKPLKPRVVAARVQTHLSYHKLMLDLHKLAHTDSLSGLANRLAFDEKIDIEFRRAVRKKESLSIVMIDIDEFKKYNDYFGHVAGDSCIRQIGQTLLSLTNRPGDFAVRYGGEEFALILPDTEKNGVEMLIRRLMSMVEDLSITHAPEAILPYITISVGFSTFSPSIAGIMSSPASIVDAADKALYRSKRNGRNCFAFASVLG